ncbi:hypothetical protein CHL76_07635 [Marinococcus halophilus]|nr:ABC transporter permease [Marinococcus halophilus]OZT80390.1 hypothetical protein CHL76_07635 [Marinococcus halophilus]
MRNMWRIFAHTFRVRAGAKSFIVSTAIMLIVVLVALSLPRIIDFFGSGEADINSLAVVNQSESLQLPEEAAGIELHTYAREEQAEKAWNSGETDGYLLFENNGSEYLGSLYTDEEAGETVQALSAGIQQTHVSQYAEELGISGEEVQNITAPVQIAESTEEAEGSGGSSTEEGFNLLSYAVVFVIYIYSLMCGIMIAMQIAKDKEQRVMEILISSASPVQHLFGRAFGVSAIWLFQMALVAVTAVIYVNVTGLDNITSLISATGGAAVSTWIYAVVFLLLGIVLYGTLYAMVGSMAAKTEEVQNFSQPLTFLLVGAFILSNFGLAAPGNIFVTASSFIPFFTPFTMFVRTNALDVPWWQIGISIGLTLALVAAAAWFSVRLYRGSVLVYSGDSFSRRVKQARELARKK